jgi:NAD(P)-dependent dehydrogenase (short-subunit alcohol dehydrogenase family)
MENHKTILITGASSGIGKACALYLDKLGYKVYAGVRQEKDGDSLKNEPTQNLIPVILDVTSEESIAAVNALISKETSGQLYALINNAGIGRGGALEVTPISEIRKVMDVNVIGLMAVTKSFIPLLRKAKGHLINIGSTSSLFASPGASVYSASKFAVRAISDSLRLELKPFGIRVTLVAPGAVESAIWDKGKAYKEQLRQTVSPETAELYKTLRNFGDRIGDVMKKIPAHKVANQVAIILNSEHPKPLYPVGKDAKSLIKIIKLPKRLLEWMILKKIEKLGK